MSLDPRASSLPGLLPRESAGSPPAGRSADRLWPRALAWALALGALLATFALYQRPGFMLDMADRLWSCF